MDPSNETADRGGGELALTDSASGTTTTHPRELRPEPPPRQHEERAAEDWRRVIDAFLDERAGLLSSIRRHFHAHPEPSREEYQTSQAIARILADADIAHEVAPSGRGVIAESEPGDHQTDARLVALRADIDALRIQDEKQDVPYRSTRDGLMHACGHDAHTAMVLGAALALKHLAARCELDVHWRAIFQPAEESGEGAAEMVSEGAMDGVSAILALHVDPERLVGCVGVRRGALTASCSEFHAVVHGRGGHAARPHQAIEALPAAAQFLLAVQQLVPRAIDSREPVVVTFGAITGGTQANVIPERVILRGTIRTLSRLVSAAVEQRIREVAQGIAGMTDTRIELTFLQGPDAVVNDPTVTDALAIAAAEVVGSAGIAEIDKPSLGGEDFSAYLAHAPGCLLRLGVVPPDAHGWPMLHSPRFDIDERALVLGAKILARGAVRLSTGVDGQSRSTGFVR